MTVTKIADGRGVKKHIYLDGEYSFTLDVEYLIKSGVFVGDELDDTDVEIIKDGYKTHCAEKRARNLLSRRSHSSKELKTKLMSKTDAENADAVVEKMKDYGYVNDERYAEIYANELWERKLFSPSRIKRELISKGVDSEIAEAAAMEYDCDEKERIHQIIESKYVLKTKTEKGRKNLFALLIRLGYGYSNVRSVLSEYTDEEYYEE